MGDTINTLTVSGRVTADAEVQELRSGTEVLKFGICVNKRMKRDDEWTDEPMFFDVETFDRYAIKLAGGITKGRKVTIHGKLDYRAWEADDGGKRSKVSIKAEEVELGEKPRGTVASDGAKPAQASAYDDDVPF